MLHQIRRFRLPADGNTAAFCKVASPFKLSDVQSPKNNITSVRIFLLAKAPKLFLGPFHTPHPELPRFQLVANRHLVTVVKYVHSPTLQLSTTITSRYQCSHYGPLQSSLSQGINSSANSVLPHAATLTREHDIKTLSNSHISSYNNTNQMH